MALLKEDGSLDVERIKKLPLSECKREIGSFTKEQYREYLSSLLLNESQQKPKVIVGGRTLEEALAMGYVDAEERINNIGKKY